MSHNIKVGDREYVIQEAYEWPLAIYLFFGGLSGALATIGVVMSFLGLNQDVVVASIVSSIVSMAIAGVVLVLFELMRPFTAWRSLSNWKHSGISWDVILVASVIGGGFLYVLPLMFDLGGLTDFLASIQVITGTLAIVAGVLFPIISGGLLSSFNTVPLWHGPGLPSLMFVTSFSAAFSLLIVVSGNGMSDNMLKTFWGAIFGLTVLVILLSISYLETVKNGPVEAQLAMGLLKKNAVFILGFVVIGLLVPAVIGGMMFFGEYASTIAMVGGVSVLIGGLTLRHYMLKAGVQTYPWPY